MRSEISKEKSLNISTNNQNLAPFNKNLMFDFQSNFLKKNGPCYVVNFVNIFPHKITMISLKVSGLW